MSEDKLWMQECLKLAAQAQGMTAPNPMVGSVIIKDGRLIGAGFHPQAGQPHAEVFAIADAQAQSESTQGATLYVNLEPCNHFGRTPPCTEAIIKAGIRRVVIGMIDPDGRVSGKGCDRLIQAGIEVTVGIAEEDCLKLNEGFIHRVKTNLPFGILKYAMTLDGKIATHTGHSYWITGSPARQQVHLLRSNCDAVITGGNTVRIDNPHLTTHNLTKHSPLRVVMSRTLNLPQSANLWDMNDHEKTLVFTESGNVNSEMVKYLTDRQVEVMALEKLSPKAVMVELGKRGCNSVLWECGGNLAASAIADGVVQKVYAFIAPKIIGGGLEAIANFGNSQMTQALALTNTQITTIGEDYLITGYLSSKF
ncbi:diaminohydroxyphosphoribosylaminopyrimidine deaminase [Synechococcus sp. PCC 7502]|uniref:bifunctional diaminohydroxyphosphoribosylaminopyrimidine deaminase/5-amino-6-(5-phosphoribosylamino)uracil reductase RibD n=1 Tax=Synechococcus sp. PCC 7502 TaxID=1173263 RepID=UPI00029FE2EA|nr:bifunctional diaminohydroxyphosphoribosylaminopyrimidine deaminase/5-amino-6-(5-phosphoribosylamino)uracil reductase RibD [Synechococcus sp. PCC 7502]AFY73161.1 diaminohydroxyphosphoribosylaminopyrimidine deaminase [Synechococcus sp. PCC 7502]